MLIDWVSENIENYFNEDLYVQDRNGRSKRADLIDYINIIKEIQKPAWMEADKAYFITKEIWYMPNYVLNPRKLMRWFAGKLLII